jgi:hypothetical protein
MNVDNHQPELIAKTLPPIQCDGCTRCCHNDAVRLLPGDDASQYQTEPYPGRPGQLMLAHKPDGSCVYLTASGCSIHDRSPTMCKQMDCRIIASRVTFTDARKLAAKRLLMLPVWRRGRELLRKAGDA